MNSGAVVYQTVQNKVLASLPGEELQVIWPYLTQVRLVLGQVLIEHHHQTEHVFFVKEGIVSLVGGARWINPTFELAMIGPEGVVGCQAVLGTDTGSFTLATVQSPGLAFRMATQDLRRLFSQCPVLHALCMKATEMLLHQIMQTAVFGANYRVLERCVRWLLMAHDRVEGNDLMITHEGMSNLLGVRRSGVTVVASGLQAAKLIRVGRGRITILDRAGLERLAGDNAWTVDVSPAPPQHWARRTADMVDHGVPGSLTPSGLVTAATSRPPH